jgi:uncharacterized protein YoxC
MLPLVQICVVLVTLAVVAIAVATVRAMVRAEKAVDRFAQLTREIQQWVVQANEFTREARETVASLRETIAPIRRVADRFEVLGERTADLSAAVLEEVEPPLRAAVAVARGMRSVTASFLERWSNRFTHGRAATNGGSDSE